MRNSISSLLVVLASAAIATPALASHQDPTAKRVRITRNGDSVKVAVITSDEVDRMIRELMASRALEQSIAQSMREAAGSAGAADSRKMRDLTDQLSRIAQKNSLLMTSIEMSCGGDRQPQGYIGVQFDLLQTFNGDEVTYSGQLRDFPKIDSVYPDSPASRAGIRRGDVVLSLGPQDTRRPVALGKILIPGTKLPVRVMRDGVSKDITVTIDKRPSDYNSDCANADSIIGPEFDAPVIFMSGAPRGGMGGVFARTPAPPAPPSAPDATVGALAPMAVPSAPMTPMAPMPAMAGAFGYAFSGASQGFAGAMLQALDDDWRATLGVDNGILVFRVAMGSPAKEAGLRNGDVVVSVDGENVSSIRAFQRIVSKADSKSVKLGIIRASKPQTIVLRWGPK